jgi:hypothetical protein
MLLAIAVLAQMMEYWFFRKFGELWRGPKEAP